MQAVALGTSSADLLCQDISPVELDYYFSLLLCHTLLNVWDSSPETEKKRRGFIHINSIMLCTEGKKITACVAVSLGRKEDLYIVLMGAALVT